MRSFSTSFKMYACLIVSALILPKITASAINYTRENFAFNLTMPKSTYLLVFMPGDKKAYEYYIYC